MLKSTSAWRSPARVFEAGCTPHAGHFRTATPGLAAAGVRAALRNVLVFRPHRSARPAKAAREPRPVETDRPRHQLAEAKTDRRRLAALRAEDFFQRPLHHRPGRRAED